MNYIELKIRFEFGIYQLTKYILKPYLEGLYLRSRLSSGDADVAKSTR